MAKCKLNEGVIKTVVNLLQEGCYAKVAAETVGINEKTYYDWINKGERDLEGNKETIYSKFCKSIKEARANGECILFKTLIQIAKEKRDWTGLAWALERMYPQRYSKHEKHEHSISTDKHLAKAFDELGLS